MVIASRGGVDLRTLQVTALLAVFLIGSTLHLRVLLRRGARFRDPRTAPAGLAAAWSLASVAVAATLGLVGWMPFGLAAVAALVWTLATGRGSVDAAIELDSRFGLKERVASALSLPAEQHDTEAGRALIDDAVSRVERIDVAGRFALSPGRPLLLPLLPLIPPSSTDSSSSACGRDRHGQVRFDGTAVNAPNSITRRSTGFVQKADLAGLVVASTLEIGIGK